MIELRPRAQLGGGRSGWPQTRYHFSFADYYSAERMHWGNLRVWNDDTIAPKMGYPLHPHSDMEIVTYVSEGAITYQDSLGNLGRTEAGEIHVMSAGSGVLHSEYNLENDDTRLFQIWILPDGIGGMPRWGTRPFPAADGTGRFTTLASGADGNGGALTMRADARVLGAALRKGESAACEIGRSRHGYLVPARGAVRLGEIVAQAGDGIAMREIDRLDIVALEDSELLLVDTL